MADQRISRRGALKYFGLIGASAAGREFLASWLALPTASADEHSSLVPISGMDHQDSEPEPIAAYVPQFFSAEEFETVQILAALIIPTDDTPGAREAQVANYIDFVVFSAAEFAPELQKEWIEGLTLLDAESQRQSGKTFRSATESERVKLLTAMSAPEHDVKSKHEGYGFFSTVKEITVEGFYTSKIGLIDVLDYQGMNYMADFPGCTHPEHQT